MDISYYYALNPHIHHLHFIVSFILSYFCYVLSQHPDFINFLLLCFITILYIFMIFQTTQNSSFFFMPVYFTSNIYQKWNIERKYLWVWQTIIHTKIFGWLKTFATPEMVRKIYWLNSSCYLRTICSILGAGTESHTEIQWRGKKVFFIYILSPTLSYKLIVGQIELSKFGMVTSLGEAN